MNEDVRTNRVGRTWRVEEPCPACRQQTIVGFLLTNEYDGHMHTRYICTFWPSGGTNKDRCTWEGWFVPEGPKPGCPTCGRSD